MAQGGSDLTVLRSAESDNLAYTPGGPASGSVSRAGFAPVLGFTGVGGTLTIDPGAGVDNVSVIGTTAADNISSPGRSPHHGSGIGTTKTASIPVSTSEAISLLTNEGADALDITVFEDVSPRLVVDGELPSAKRDSDAMVVRNGSANHVQYRNVQSHDPGQGTVFATYRSTGNETRIEYTGIEDIEFFR